MPEAGIYKHFKGNEYRLIGLASHSETGEELVIYESLDKKKIWARPLKMFLGEVEVNGQKVPRFKYLGP